ncbi:hypothetical protein [Brucella thiophenivorans]|uniref:Uncharacterized protein n=1 Tax=Brucella thiophenivorans TaxID=571255 RepID=A0A256FIU0_9HYPH|nr:hypothetical protein [Brucella thiophenivorans]OYR14764.1 hypothetical protein CEV31_3138 [Brucella thiophenivorans]
MKISLFFLTKSRRLRDFLSLKKGAIIPKDALNRGCYRDVSPVISHFEILLDEQTTSTDVEGFILNKAIGSDAVIVFVDKTSTHLLSNVRNSILIVELGEFPHNTNYQNLIHPQIALALRTISHIIVKFSSFDNYKLLALPLRNFSGQDLSELARLHRDNWYASNYSELIEAQLVSLRKRVRPRRRSDMKNVYAVDDNKRFFSYGYEQHSRQATGRPHLPSCELSANFRFGAKIESTKHYNVSETEGDETTIKGTFIDCHGDSHDKKKKTHLNMFSSDFF